MLGQVLLPNKFQHHIKNLIFKGFSILESWIKIIDPSVTFIEDLPCAKYCAKYFMQYLNKSSQ